MRTVFLTAALLAALVFALAGCGNSETEATAGNQTETQAQSQAETAQNTATQSRASAAGFSVQTLDGETITLESHDGPVLLNFWATWCPPCRNEMPYFTEIYDAYKDDGLLILGVSVDKQGRPVVDKFLQENDISYPIAMGDDGQLFMKYQAMIDPAQQGGIPFTLVFDSNDQIVHKIVGYRDKATWKRMLLPLIEES